MGLLGRGGVHSHSEHLFAFLRAGKKAGIEKIAIHVFTDGRDTAPQSSSKYLKELETVLEEVGIGFIASASGRFFAMDRDNNWDRVSRAEEAIFEGIGKIEKTSKPSEIISKLHKTGILDEHLEPIVFLDENGKNYKVEKNDGVFFFNFRSDRARMLSKKIAEKAKSENLFFATLTEYEKSLRAEVAFSPVKIETTIAKEISESGLTQVHIAETEKFPHATYFLNGGVEKPIPLESHELLPSRKDVPTHDLAPEMRAEAIADKAIEYIEKGTNFIFINFANPDMVGHTANVPAIIRALEEVDKQLSRVIEKLTEKGGVAFITADHGNAEVNFDVKTNTKHTAHTTNPVPAIITDTEFKFNKKDGGLADIAPTVLNFFGIQSSEMSGENLGSSI
jgi:2,3-bisphosphoglycerate-independent phosphoglycerate mutase